MVFNVERNIGRGENQKKKRNINDVFIEPSLSTHTHVYTCSKGLCPSTFLAGQSFLMTRRIASTVVAILWLVMTILKDGADFLPLSHAYTHHCFLICRQGLCVYERHSRTTSQIRPSTTTSTILMDYENFSSTSFLSIWNGYQRFCFCCDSYHGRVFSAGSAFHCEQDDKRNI